MILHTFIHIYVIIPCFYLECGTHTGGNEIATFYGNQTLTFQWNIIQAIYMCVCDGVIT
jgi:hypothetical protein